LATGDVYTLKLSGNLHSQTINNMFYYVDNAVSGGDAQVLGELFEDWMLPVIATIVSSSYTMTDIEVQNLSDPTDFFVLSTSVPGVRGATTQGPFQAWGFRLNAASLVEKSGAKRIAGVAESDTTNGIVDGTMLSSVNSVGAALGNGLPLVGTKLFRPRIRHLANPGELGPPEYYYGIIASGVYTAVTTQNSRKYGRGV